MTRFSMYSGERIRSSGAIADDRLSVDFDTLADVYRPPSQQQPTWQPECNDAGEAIRERLEPKVVRIQTVANGTINGRRRRNHGKWDGGQLGKFEVKCDRLILTDGLAAFALPKAPLTFECIDYQPMEIYSMMALARTTSSCGKFRKGPL